jgi:lysophospholipase L1-like esterase
LVLAALVAIAVVGVWESYCEERYYSRGYAAGLKSAVDHRYVPTRQSMILMQVAQLPARGSVVLLGDSITDGLFLSSNSGNLLNAGIGGAEVADVLSLAKKIFDRVKPSVMLVTIGINNAMKGREQFNPESLRREYTEICKYISSKGTRLILSTVFPVAKNRPLGDVYFDMERVRRINGIIKAVAEEERIELLDGFAYFVDPEGYLPSELTTDGVHLNAAGYEKWKKRLARYINIVLSE